MQIAFGYCFHSVNSLLAAIHSSCSIICYVVALLFVFTPNREQTYFALNHRRIYNRRDNGLNYTLHCFRIIFDDRDFGNGSPEVGRTEGLDSYHRKIKTEALLNGLLQ